MTTLVIMAAAAWLPYSPLALALGFTALPPLYWPLLLATSFCYVVLTQLVKMWLIRKAWLKPQPESHGATTRLAAVLRLRSY